MKRIIFIGFCIIFSAAKTEVIQDDESQVPETTSVTYSNEQTELPSYLLRADQVKQDLEIEWKIQLPKNASAKTQQKLFNKLMPFLAKQFDSLRKKRRQDQQYHANSLNDRKPDEDNDRPFSLEDVQQYFKVGDVQINPDDNTAAFKINVTEKIYTELEKRNVRETKWYQKAIEQRNSKWVRQ